MWALRKFLPEVPVPDSVRVATSCLELIKGETL